MQRSAFVRATLLHCAILLTQNCLRNNCVRFYPYQTVHKFAFVAKVSFGSFFTTLLRFIEALPEPLITHQQRDAAIASALQPESDTAAWKVLCNLSNPL